MSITTISRVTPTPPSRPAAAPSTRASARAAPPSTERLTTLRTTLDESIDGAGERAGKLAETATGAGTQVIDRARYDAYAAVGAGRRGRHRPGDPAPGAPERRRGRRGQGAERRHRHRRPGAGPRSRPCWARHVRHRGEKDRHGRPHRCRRRSVVDRARESAEAYRRQAEAASRRPARPRRGRRDRAAQGPARRARRGLRRCRHRHRRGRRREAVASSGGREGAATRAHNERSARAKKAANTRARKTAAPRTTAAREDRAGPQDHRHEDLRHEGLRHEGHRLRQLSTTARCDRSRRPVSGPPAGRRGVVVRRDGRSTSRQGKTRRARIRTLSVCTCSPDGRAVGQPGRDAHHARGAALGARRLRHPQPAGVPGGQQADQAGLARHHPGWFAVLAAGARCRRCHGPFYNPILLIALHRGAGLPRRRPARRPRGLRGQRPALVSAVRSVERAATWLHQGCDRSRRRARARLVGGPRR